MIKGPGYGLTFLYYFALTSALSIVLAHQEGVAWSDPALYKLAVPFGLLAASIGAYINQNTLVTIPVKKNGAKTKQLNESLENKGYAKVANRDGVAAYSRSGLAKLLSGPIFVQIEPRQIMISGRATTVRSIEKQLTDK
ncbi:hypothetical protein IQ266_23960 [filamentous cyanobacterium LEGE 11480]|uniref:Uncharacterized protein n=1 Tax=Romeriopsis navalis LEGE 11480 TaxID=2777977 RepID=A0A928VUJ8_9CYAN|nr:hypothetical protein [Romeriopsis navalis]MBE9032797.1 hypothetical protein [Romeriopsis navalis LEGE 11480]